jgi:hypothetical protein
MWMFLSQEVPGAVRPGVGEELLGFGVFDDRAVGHEDDAVRGATGEAHLVGHHEHRHALLGEGGHDGQHFVDHLWIERAGGLVEQHHLRVHRERASDRHSLLLSARQLRGILVGLIGDADALEERHRGGVRPFLGLFAHLDRSERHVLQNRLVREQVERLEHHADVRAQLGQLAPLVR